METMHESEAMAVFIDRWLGNRLFRAALRQVTKRCPWCGRRTENSIEKYPIGHGGARAGAAGALTAALLHR